MISVNEKDIEEILIKATEDEGNYWENLTPITRVTAIAGTLKVFEAMQTLGWRIIPPLKEVKS